MTEIPLIWSLIVTFTAAWLGYVIGRYDTVKEFDYDDAI